MPLKPLAAAKAASTFLADAASGDLLFSHRSKGDSALPVVQDLRQSEHQAHQRLKRLDAAIQRLQRRLP